MNTFVLFFVFVKIQLTLEALQINFILKITIQSPILNILQNGSLIMVFEIIHTFFSFLSSTVVSYSWTSLINLICDEIDTSEEHLKTGKNHARNRGHSMDVILLCLCKLMYIHMKRNFIRSLVKHSTANEEIIIHLCIPPVHQCAHSWENWNALRSTSQLLLSIYP